MPHEDYYAALKRLVEGRPIRVSKGTRITNDAVSLEAGKGKGSIKKSRPQFADLIVAIAAEAAAQKQTPAEKLVTQLAKAKEEANDYRTLYEAALAREEALLAQVMDLKHQMRALDGRNVLPLRNTTATKP